MFTDTLSTKLYIIYYYIVPMRIREEGNNFRQNIYNIYISKYMYLFSLEREKLK